MKNKILLLLLIAAFAVSASAQEDKKKKKSSAPKTEVVQLETETRPIIVEQPVAQKPANGSLYTDNAVNGNLLGDFKARRIGDLVFVDVVEASEAVVESGASRKRDSGALTGVVAGAVETIPLPGASIAGGIVGALGKRNYEGKGSTQRASEIRARLTARVVEVLPNGDLRIEAMKQVKINKETELVAVTGIVRTSDVGANNSIPTTQIGDLRVEFNGKGVASKDNAPGWLFRLFDKISPF